LFLSIGPSSLVAVSMTSCSELRACRASPADGAAEDDHHLLAFERRDDHHLRPRQQRGVHFERRIFRGGADEDDVSRFDKRQKGVLLRLVESVDLVDEDDRLRAAGLPFPARFLHQRPDLFDRAAGGGERDELGPGLIGDDARQGGFSGTGRPPEDHRGDAIALDGGAQEASFAEELVESDDVFEGARTQSFG
jgi:hypothetical protein